MKAKALLSATTELEVQFFDVDSMRVVWHGNYVKYLEVARCELLKLFDYNYLQMEASGYMWPIVDMRIKYVASAKLSEWITIEASLVEYQTRIKIDYIVRDKTTQKILTKAHTIQVAVEMSTGEMSFNTPQCLLDKLAPFLDKE
ncbi:acyl-CoA thioesterase [Paraglaciecola arctica]|uniref:Acyl-CoA thioester hydrolase n=1 Tax=Paraglaciecola arctica BSs20135 TaxID=493475 RepID=K6YFZ4_9ALTE|nr:acyl-CoA thioesterase [Paraglaciecola arctica]GAC17082.1 acyl-CoA thioester hydrolase [Paraglaciecola arctica BSs20135]